VWPDFKMINVMTISRNVQDKYAAMFGLRNARIYSMKKRPALAGLKREEATDKLGQTGHKAITVVVTGAAVATTARHHTQTSQGDTQ